MAIQGSTSAKQTTKIDDVKTRRFYKVTGLFGQQIIPTDKRKSPCDSISLKLSEVKAAAEYGFFLYSADTSYAKPITKFTFGAWEKYLTSILK